MAVPWTRTRKRRRRQSQPNFPDGLYHIDRLLKYISYHRKPARGCDVSVGGTCGAPRTRSRASLLLRLHIHRRLDEETVTLFDILTIKKSFKQDLSRPPSKETTGGFPCSQKKENKNDGGMMVSLHYSDSFCCCCSVRSLTPCHFYKAIRYFIIVSIKS